jgi:hypothetical protein
MIYEEFIESFNTKFYAATTVDSMGWEEDEICNFLNSAQIQLINKLALEGNFNLLSDIIVEDTVSMSTAISTPHDTKQFVELPEDFMHFVGGSLEVTKLMPVINTLSFLPLEKVPLPLAFRSIASTENKTLFSNPRIAFMSEVFINKAMVVVDSYTTSIGDIKVTYVKQPEKFDADNSGLTDVNVLLHDDIVNTAVQIAVTSMIGTQQSSQ